MNIRVMAIGLSLVGAASVASWMYSGYQRAGVVAQREAQLIATRLANELNDELVRITQREDARPYYEFTPYYADPRALNQNPNALARSPLVDAPSEPFIRGYFQVVQVGQRVRITMPNLTDEVASAVTNVGAPPLPTASPATRALHAQLAQIADAIMGSSAAGGEAPPLVIAATQQLTPQQFATNRDLANDLGATLQQAAQPQQRTRPSENAQGTVEANAAPDAIANAAPSAAPPHAQNSASPYAQNPAPPMAQHAAPNARLPTPRDAAPTLGSLPPQSNCVTPSQAASMLVRSVAYRPQQVTMAGQPQLLATRIVATPSGDLRQGLVFAQDQVLRWLRMRDARASLRFAATPNHAPHAPQVVAASAAQPVGQPPPTTHTAATTPPTSAQAAPRAGSVAWSNGIWQVTLPASVVAAAQVAFLRSAVPVGIGVGLALALVIWVLLRTDALARQKARFASSAAHELRTPLAGLVLYGEMLADNLGDPHKRQQYARHVADEATRLGRVVSNMLGVSQLERGAVRVRVETADLIAAVIEIAGAVGPGVQANGASLTLELAPPIDAAFDRDALTHILTNLLDNAEKYSRQHRRDIVLEVGVTAHHAFVRISDHGPGVAKPQQLFKPFARQPGPDAPAGLGLGLALSRQLAQAMGGTLTYHRTSDVTAFTLTVPLADTAASKPATSRR